MGSDQEAFEASRDGSGQEVLKYRGLRRFTLTLPDP